MVVSGVALAGGAGRRMGRGKPAVRLGGRPLISYPLAALADVCERVAVVCKRSTKLPELPGVERWDEPDEPRHPLTGIVHALERAAGPVLVCAADMPFVTPDALRSLLAAASSGHSAPAGVAVAAGRLEPLLGLYAPAALEALCSAPPDAALSDSVGALDPVRVALPPALVRSVNTPDELAQAESELRAAR